MNNLLLKTQESKNDQNSNLNKHETSCWFNSCLNLSVFKSASRKRPWWNQWEVWSWNMKNTAQGLKDFLRRMAGRMSQSCGCRIYGFLLSAYCFRWLLAKACDWLREVVVGGGSCSLRFRAAALGWPAVTPTWTNLKPIWFFLQWQQFIFWFLHSHCSSGSSSFWSIIDNLCPVLIKSYLMLIVSEVEALHKLWILFQQLWSL